MLKNSSLPFLGFLHATKLLIYVLLVVWLIDFIDDKTTDGGNEIFAGVTMILLFVISAVVSALIVLAKPIQLFVKKKQAEAFQLLRWTVGWMLLYFISFVLVFINA